MIRSFPVIGAILVAILLTLPVFSQSNIYLPVANSGAPTKAEPASPTATITLLPSATPTATPSATPTNAPTQTSTTTPTNTSTPTITPTFTPTFTPTPTTTPCGSLAGNIVTDTMLIAGCGYDITSDVLVTTSVTLSIPAGVSLRFGPGVNMMVDGSLRSIGTKDSPVIFTRNSDTYWGGIRITEKSGSSSALVYTVIEHGYGNGGVYGTLAVIDSQPTLSNITFQYNRSAFSIYGQTNSQPVILSDGKVISNTDTAILGRGNQVLTNFYFFGNSAITTDAVLTVCPGSQVVNSTFISNTITAIKATYCFGDNGTLIKNNVISGNQGAIRTTQNSDSIIESNDIFNNAQVLLVNFGYSYTRSAIFTACETRLTNNNIYSNTAMYAAGGQYGDHCEIDAMNNWWGTTVDAEIDALILDAGDEIPRGDIIYAPFSPAPFP